MRHQIRINPIVNRFVDDLIRRQARDISDYLDPTLSEQETITLRNLLQDTNIDRDGIHHYGLESAIVTYMDLFGLDGGEREYIKTPTVDFSDTEIGYNRRENSFRLIPAQTDDYWIGALAGEMVYDKLQEKRRAEAGGKTSETEVFRKFTRSSLQRLRSRQSTVGHQLQGPGPHLDGFVADREIRSLTAHYFGLYLEEAAPSKRGGLYERPEDGPKWKSAAETLYRNPGGIHLVKDLIRISPQDAMERLKQHSELGYSD